MRNPPSSDRPYPTRVPPSKRVPTHPSKTTLLDRSKPVHPRHATSGRTRQPISRALAFESQPLTSAWKRSILDSDSLALSSRQPAPTEWSTPRPRPLPRSTESKVRNTSIDKDYSSPRDPITPQKKACSSLIRFSKISPALFPPPGFPLSARKLQSGAARRPLPNDGSVTQEFRTLTSAGKACITDTNICSAHSHLPSRPLSPYLPSHRWVPMLFPKRLGFLHNTHVAHGIDHQTASTALGRVAPKGTTLPNRACSPTEAGSPDRSPHPKS